MEIDASDYTVASILSITCADSELCPVAFYSWTLTAELNYNTHDKELLAIFEAFQSWHHYLEGSATLVDIVMDHKNLEYFSTSKVLTHQQARWSELLSTSTLGSSVLSLMLLLDDGMSTTKRGIVATPR